MPTCCYIALAVSVDHVTNGIVAVWQCVNADLSLEGGIFWGPGVTLLGPPWDERQGSIVDSATWPRQNF